MAEKQPTRAEAWQAAQAVAGIVNAAGGVDETERTIYGAEDCRTVEDVAGLVESIREGMVEEVDALIDELDALTRRVDDLESLPGEFNRRLERGR